MKKIFTFLISFGLLSAAFAESGNDRRGQNEGYISPSSSNVRHDRDGRNVFQPVADNRDRHWNENEGRSDNISYNTDRDRQLGDRDDHMTVKYRGGAAGYESYSQPVQVSCNR